MTLFVAALPPPVGGQSLSNERLLHSMHEAGRKVNWVDVSQDPSLGALEYHLGRIKKVLSAAVMVLRSDSQRALYCVLEAGLGMIYTIVLIACARLGGRKIFLHHHSAAHIYAFSARFWLVARLGGCATTHVVLCERMRLDLIKQYQLTQVLVCWNAAIMPIQERHNRPVGKPITLGHLGNLRVEKGINEVICTFRSVLSQVGAAELILAGPAVNDQALLLIEAAKKEFGDKFKHIGPVIGNNKDAFYRNIDIFLFPSKFKIEAQPLVILEALSFGVVCVTSKQGYIADIIENTGLAISDLEKYEGLATQKILEWISTPSEFEIEKRKTYDRFAELHIAALQQERDLIEAVSDKRAFSKWSTNL